MVTGMPRHCFRINRQQITTTLGQLCNSVKYWLLMFSFRCRMTALRIGARTSAALPSSTGLTVRSPPGKTAPPYLSRHIIKGCIKVHSR